MREMESYTTPKLQIQVLWTWLVAGQYHDGKVWRCPKLDIEGVSYKYYQGISNTGDCIEMKLFDDVYEIGYQIVPNMYPPGTAPGNSVMSGFCHKKERVRINLTVNYDFDANDLYNLIRSYKQGLRDKKIDTCLK